MEKLLTINDLSYSYHDGNGERVIFDKVNIDFENGRFYTITGDSGSGKTTFLYLIAGLDDTYQGKIFYKGLDIKQNGLDRYRKEHVAMIFQNYNLIEYLSPLINIRLALNIQKSEKRDDEIYALLESLHIDRQKARRRSSTLSGGEKQRVAIARALATDAKIVIADEPTGNLDHKVSTDIMDIFKDLSLKHNKCIIMVTHNTELCKYADVHYYIDEDDHKIKLQKNKY